MGFRCRNTTYSVKAGDISYLKQIKRKIYIYILKKLSVSLIDLVAKYNIDIKKIFCFSSHALLSLGKEKDRLARATRIGQKRLSKLTLCTRRTCLGILSFTLLIIEII